jgi:hypothetical protein
LEAFLKSDAFPIRLKTIYVDIPDNSPAGAPSRLSPTGNLTVTVDKTTYEFAPIGDPERNARTFTTRYAFSKAGDVAFSFVPGQEMVIRLGLRTGDELRFLTWWRCHSRMYTFERLVRNPFLHRAANDFNPQRDEYWKEVALSFSQDSILPKVPDLLPAVRLGP